MNWTFWRLSYRVKFTWKGIYYERGWMVSKIEPLKRGIVNYSIIIEKRAWQTCMSATSSSWLGILIYILIKKNVLFYPRIVWFGPIWSFLYGMDLLEFDFFVLFCFVMATSLLLVMEHTLVLFRKWTRSVD